jgi:hypothetical protein
MVRFGIHAGRATVALASPGRQGYGKEGRTSFLKKRSKKLLLIASNMGATRENHVLPLIDKSFLVLFFKKELLFLPSGS